VEGIDASGLKATAALGHASNTSSRSLAAGRTMGEDKVQRPKEEAYEYHLVCAAVYFESEPSARYPPNSHIETDDDPLSDFQIYCSTHLLSLAIKIR